MRNICKTLFVPLLFLSQIALADEGYQFETTLTHDRYKSDSGYKTSDNVLDATYYLSKVDTRTYPFQEAAFMARSSSIGIGIGKGDAESSSIGYQSDNKSYSLMASYANPGHPYVITGEINESKLDSIFGKSETKSFTITPGYYLRDNLLLSASLMKSETEYTGGTYDIDTVWLTSKWLHVLPSGKTYNFTAAVARSNYDSTFSSSSHATIVYLSSEYYLTRAFSLGALVVVADSSDSDDAKNYGLSSSWYITPSLFAKLSGIKYNGDSADSDNVSVALGTRF